MPTLEHNGLVELFRANPSIAPQFIESLFNMKVPKYTSVRVVEAAQDQMLPSSSERTWSWSFAMPRASLCSR